MSGLPVQLVFSSSGSAIIGTLRSNDEDGNAKVEKIYRFYEQNNNFEQADEISSLSEHGYGP